MEQFHVTVDKVTREEIWRRIGTSILVKRVFKDGSVKEYYDTGELKSETSRSGGVYYYNKKGQMHCEDGPAYADKISGNDYYYLFGIAYNNQIEWANDVCELATMRNLASKFGYTLSR